MLVVPVLASPGVWTPLEDDNRRFYRILSRVWAIFCLFCVVMPFLPVPEILRDEPEILVVPVAKLLLEKPKRTPPAVPPAPVQSAPVEAPPVQAAPAKPAPKPAPPPPSPPQKREVAPKAPVSPKESVARVGLLAMRGDLMQLRESNTLKRFSEAPSSLIRSVPAPTKAPVVGVPISDVAAGSGGIDVSNLSQTVGKADLRGHTATSVSTATIVGGEGGSGDGSGAQGKRSRGRTIEDIQLTLQAHKGTFDILYSKELRSNPGLRGRVVFELIIAPSGEVVQCKILGSELNSPELERRFMVKLRSIGFGAKNVDTTVISYPLEFSPA